MISKSALLQLEAEGWKVQRIFDGPPASGKTTRARMLVGSLKSNGYETIHEQTEDGDIVLARPFMVSARMKNEGHHDNTLKAITVWQPWASLIILGFKPYEFRGWPTPRNLRGRRIAIHAGARPVKRSEVAELLLLLRGPEAWTTGLTPRATETLEAMHQQPGILPLGHVLGTAVLGEPVRSWQIVGEFGGPIDDSDRSQHSNWAWPLREIVPLEPPVEARGAQGFWDWRATR